MLSEEDAQQINRRRTTGASIADRMKPRHVSAGTDVMSILAPPIKIIDWPTGAQAHIGNEVHGGDLFPMIVTEIWGPGCCNGQVFLDGNDVLWVTSVMEGPGPHTWIWPAKE